MLNLLSTIERAEIGDYCFRKYGLDLSEWDDYSLVKSSEAVWAIPNKLKSFLEEFSTEEYETAGLRIFSGKKFPYKITESFVSLFGKKLSRGILNLKGSELKKLMFEKEVTVVGDCEVNDGYVVIRYKDLYVGIGLKRGLKIDSQIPKKLVNQLSYKLEISD